MTSAAIYARVSSARQKKDQTIGSQTAALRVFAAEQHLDVPEEWVFEDEGHSGATLTRPALERLRDLVAQVAVDVVLCYSPDRLARKFAYQAVLIEEFARAGTTVRFVKGPRGDTPEDALMVQFQGMFAEYEKAQLMERYRRGKAYRARAGSVNVLGGAPFGYRYGRKTPECGGTYDIVEHEAHLVAELFRRYTDDGATIADLTRWLTACGTPTRTGKTRWDRSVVWGMLRNPAYAGTAMFGKTAAVHDQPVALNRVARLAGRTTPRAVKTVDRPREAWIVIPVPAIISTETFERAAQRLAENKRFAPRNANKKVPWLLQGLAACAACGYGYYRTSTTTSSGKKIYYYRCLGSDDYRYAAGRVCANKPVRADLLDAVVWEHITALISDPRLIRAEIDKRLAAARTGDPATKVRARLVTAAAKADAAITRMIQAFSEQLITIDELRSRMPDLRARQANMRSQLDALETQLADRDAYLKLADDLEGFLAQLHDSANTAEIPDRQRVLRLLVKDVLIGPETITIRHRIPIRERGPSTDQRHETTDTEGDMQASCQLRRGREHAALRSTGDRPLDTPVHHHPGLKPLPQQLQNPTITDPPGHLDHKRFMIDLIEEVFDVELHHKGEPADKPGPDAFHGLGRGPLGPEPVRARKEIRLEHRFQHQLRRSLRHAITHGRDTQRPEPAWLRDQPAPIRRRTIPSLAKVPLEFAEHPTHPVGLHVRQGHTIDPGRSAILPDPLPRLPQDVTPVDTVVQGMEAPLRRRLGRSP
jgi:DNA invertase Pin-like site-specific DNA recombinase